MNAQQRALCLEVADILEKDADFVPWQHSLFDETKPEGPCFTMESVQYKCGAPACLAGWILHRAYENGMLESKLKELGNPVDVAQYILGITDDEALDLFQPVKERNGYWYDEDEPDSQYFITPKHAAACLRHFTETLEVNWRGTVPEEEPA